MDTTMVRRAGMTPLSSVEEGARAILNLATSPAIEGQTGLYFNGLREVTGIGPKRAERIIAGWADQRVIREIMLFMHSNGVGTSRAVRIYKTYGADPFG
jgi:hypothetical protein